jgi:L-rhamnose isomerase/sugar isomerase
MLDQSHNVTDPIESLMQSAIELQRAYAQALIVDRPALSAAQAANDALGAHLELKRAYTTDVSPILAMARLRAGGAHPPIQNKTASG